MLYWIWPAGGEVMSGFEKTSGVDGPLSSQGLNIAGNPGEPVYAASDGKVVYSGQGLRGYGKLIILRHNDRFLSAYGHNKTLMVSEGDTVKAGDQIAEIGSTGIESSRLHFQIRKDGKPVDPLEYLPKRQILQANQQ
jgi:lipoprotein NlpD